LVIFKETFGFLGTRLRKRTAAETQALQAMFDQQENAMTTQKFALTIHMVSSLDGMIAKNDNSVSWFETSSNYEKGVSGQDPEEFLKTIDCYVMGSHTYELALALSKTHGWAYGDKPTMVVTSRKLPVERPNIEFYSGDLRKLVNDRLKPNYKNVWLVGGAMLARDFIRLKLVDEIRVSVLPVILGDGILFFDHIGQEHPLHLKDVTAYRNGMIELCYEVPVNSPGNS
jgi:dihydrofolate reductase